MMKSIYSVSLKWCRDYKNDMMMTTYNRVHYHGSPITGAKILLVVSLGHGTVNLYSIKLFSKSM